MTDVSNPRADFEPLDDLPIPAAESLPVSAGRERWMTWRRAGKSAA